MTDAEKNKLMAKILAEAWECIPPAEVGHEGAYWRGIALALEVVATHGEGEENER